MERLVTVREMRDRYRCSNPTARKYLRECVPHMENPLVAPEWAVQAWEDSRVAVPQKRTVTIRSNTGRVVVPRKW